MYKKKNISNLIIITFMVVLISTALYFLNLFNKFELVARDRFMKAIRSTRKTSDKVVVILIDESSLEMLNPVVGRWPWPRAIYSDLLEFLAMGKPSAIFFDILFTEYQTNNPEGQLNENDMQLVNATRRTGNVYHAMELLHDNEDEFNKTMLNQPLPEDFQLTFSQKNIQTNSRLRITGDNNVYYIPFPELYRAAHGVTVVDIIPDIDGVLRKIKPFFEYQGNYYVSSGLAPFIDNNPILMNPNQVVIGDTVIPIDEKGNCYLNFYGKLETYSVSGIFASLQKIRIGDVENLIIHPREFEGKIVYFGASASGLHDLKPTPINTRVPGVYLHAMVASNFIQNEFLVPPSRFYTLLSVFMVAIICVPGIFYMKNFFLSVCIPFVIFIGWILFYIIQFEHNIIYEFTPPLIAVLESCVFSFGYLVMTERREKQKVKKMFSMYVSPVVLKDILQNYSEYYALDIGNQVDITVLFTDIRGFTSYSDNIPPQQVVKMLNCFFSHMSTVIFRNNGTIDKYIGDAIMAFWGAPVMIENHPDHAITTAIAMLQELDHVKKDLKNMGIDYDLKIGIGINTGKAVLGNIGSEKKLNYTAIGDTINLASRLEGQTKVYGTPILISEFTRSRLKKDVPIRIVDIVQIRGKLDKVRIYEVLCPETEKSLPEINRICDLTNQAFKFFHDKEYHSALEKYSLLEDSYLKKLFIKRCNDELSKH